jgi:hypothetical protein
MRSNGAGLDGDGVEHRVVVEQLERRLACAMAWTRTTWRSPNRKPGTVITEKPMLSFARARAAG